VTRILISSVSCWVPWLQAMAAYPGAEVHRPQLVVDVTARSFGLCVQASTDVAVRDFLFARFN
jgi:hypothetical protein